MCGGYRAGQSKQQSDPILTFIDRKINGALIQDLAGRGEGGRGGMNSRGGKRIKKMRWKKKKNLEVRPLSVSQRSSATGGMCEQPVVAFCALCPRRTALESGGTSFKWNPRVEEEEKEEKRREKINFPREREADWSNGGLKEEEERTYFPLITSCSLSDKPSKPRRPRSSDLSLKQSLVASFSQLLSL